MARFVLQYLALNNNELLPNSIKVAKIGSQFCQILNKPSKFAKDFYFFAKVAKFRQIWSH